jgi:hypothetical protein
MAALNDLGRIASHVGWRGPSLDPDDLVAAARRKTGLVAFGDDGLIDRLRVLVGSIEADARLAPFGRYVARVNLVRMLTNRLRMEADLAAHPEILETPLEAPVIVAGLQRTGTTMIHRVLGWDRAFRVLASWEAINPAPPQRGNGIDIEARIRMAKLAELSLRYMAPDFFAVHPVEAEEPEEDCLLLDCSLMSTSFEGTQMVWSFSSWLERQDHEPAYRFLDRALRYLSWQRPGGRWLLKTPHHLEHFEEVLKVFPGARIIWPHRHPGKAIASFSSMMCHAYGVFSDEVDPHEVGRRWLWKNAYMIERALAARRAHGDDGFLDVHYADLLKDPEGQFRRIYEHVGRPFDGAAAARVRAWLAANPQNKHGRHRYDLASFGLTHADVERAFADYIAHFDIAPEQ